MQEYFFAFLPSFQRSYGSICDQKNQWTVCGQKIKKKKMSSSSSSKRKRSNSSSSTSSKSGRVTLKIGDGTGAVLASFPSGPPAPGTLLGKTAGKAERAQWHLYGEPSSKMNEVLVGTTARMQWQAESATGIAGHGLKAAKKRRNNDINDVGSCYLVGVYDPKKKEVTMHYAGDRIHPLDQTIRRAAGRDGPKQQAFEDFSYREQREELTMGFGSQGSKAGLKRMKKNILTEDNVGTKDFLMAQVAMSPHGPGSNADSRVASSANAIAEENHKRSMLPPFNKETEDCAEIFSFEKILPSNELLSLRDLVKNYDRSIAKENAEIEDAWQPQSGYVRHLTKDLVERYSSKKERREIITKLIFLDCLFKFNRASSRIRPDADHPDIGSLAEKYRMPEIIFRYLLQQFTVKATKVDQSTKVVTEVYSKTDKTNKRLSLWILVMALHAESFNIKTIYPMAKELKKDTKSVLDLFRYFGCTYIPLKKKSSGSRDRKSTHQSDYSVKLKAPLMFPKPRFQGRR